MKATPYPPTPMETHLLASLGEVARGFDAAGMRPRDILTCFVNFTAVMVLQNEGPGGLDIVREIIDAIEKNEVN